MYPNNAPVAPPPTRMKGAIGPGIIVSREKRKANTEIIPRTTEIRINAVSIFILRSLIFVTNAWVF
jgi:hypothetical protein